MDRKLRQLMFVNRQPTLWRHGLPAIRVLPVDDDSGVIKISPLMIEPLNADFDGDCIDGYIKILCDHKVSLKELHISNFSNQFKTTLISEKDNVKNYTVDEDVFIKSINRETQDIDWKKITHWSIHTDLEMYKVRSEKFKTFWCSSDHSLIVFDEIIKKIEEKSPIDILENPVRYSLIKLKENILTDENVITNYKLKNICPYELISCTNLSIELDKEKTIGYDLTVENYFTFCTADGVFVMDTMAIYCIHDTKALEEMRDKAYIKNTIYYDRSPEFLSTIRHEALYGAFLLSRTNLDIDESKIIKLDRIEDLAETPELYKEPKTCILYKNKKYSYGLVLLNKWCNFNDIYIDFEITKKTAQLVSKKIYEYNQEQYHENLSNLEKNLFFYVSIADYHPATINIDEMINLVDPETKELLNKIPENIELGYTINQALIGKCLTNLKQKNNTLYNLVKSASRFSEKQLSRSCINIGYCANADNEIIPKPINTNLITGLTEDEFFAGASGTRKGIADKGRFTPDSGYLERSLVMGLSPIQIAEEDCGTPTFLTTKIINETHKDTLIGKYIRKNNDWVVIDQHIRDQLTVGEEISIRSPIYCSTPNFQICKKCWGEKQVQTKYIGILAGQILSERFTQLTLRSFHDSGSAHLDDNRKVRDFIQYHLKDIVRNDKNIELIFDVENIINDFKELTTCIDIKPYKAIFVNSKNKIPNEDPIKALRVVKTILKALKKNIKTPQEYYNLLMTQILSVGNPYSGFCELLLTNMFISDVKNNILWRYQQNSPIVYKMGDKTMSSKVSPLLNLLYQQNQKTIANIEFLDDYINSDNLTIYEKIFLEKF